ncbi:MAG: hypothetical protein JWQ08_1037 [Deinococcus sp.]|nr:hypothetical protein [Deinococcus sp.]
MKHLLFPTVAQADAFVQDLRSQGVIREELGESRLNRTAGTGTTSQTQTTTEVVELRGNPDEAAEGAVKGTGLGAVAGAVAGAAAVALTGGLAAVPVILGAAALGSGVGAVGGASVGYTSGDDVVHHVSDVSDDHYERMNSTVESGGRAIAVDDNIPSDVLEAAVTRHGGQFV